jgi:hypothetical protein
MEYKIMAGFNFEEFKLLLQRKREENYKKLLEEIKVLKANIEHFLTLFFESTTSKTQTMYTNLQMH